MPKGLRAADGALPGAGTGASNIDNANSNALRGYSMNGNNRRNGHDQDNGEEAGYNLDPRGSPSPAQLWNASVGTDGNDDAVTPDNLADFVRAAVNRFDPQQRQQFFMLLEPILGEHDANEGEAAEEVSANDRGRGAFASDRRRSRRP